MHVASIAYLEKEFKRSGIYAEEMCKKLNWLKVFFIFSDLVRSADSFLELLFLFFIEIGTLKNILKDGDFSMNI